MANNTLAPHEILELREQMSTSILGTKKIQMSMEMVQDEELKGFIERCLDSKKAKIDSIQTFIENNTNMNSDTNTDNNT